MASTIDSSQIENDAASASGSDSKKRNRLGYHRSSVACVHCRRRKIRCMPSADHYGNRCQNCIRLKKDCLYHSIDEVRTPTRKSRSQSRIDSSNYEPNGINESQAANLLVPIMSNSYNEEHPISDLPPTSWDKDRVLEASPSEQVGHPLNLDEQHWRTSSQVQTHSQYSQHDSHAGHPTAGYWASDNNLTSTHQQPQLTLATNGVPFSREPHIIYHNVEPTNISQSAEFGNFGSSTNVDLNLSPVVYQHHHMIFPETRRSATIPEMYPQITHMSRADVHVDSPYSPAYGHFTADPGYFPDTANELSWFSATSTHQPWSPGFLPAQSDRTPRYMQNLG